MDGHMIVLSIRADSLLLSILPNEGISDSYVLIALPALGSEWSYSSLNSRWVLTTSRAHAWFACVSRVYRWSPITTFPLLNVISTARRSATFCASVKTVLQVVFWMMGIATFMSPGPRAR